MYSPIFERFWSVYPRRQGKYKAFQSWKRQKLDLVVDEIIEHVEARIRLDPQWQNPKYIPHGSTFVNQRLWEDEIPEYTDDDLSYEQIMAKLGIE